MEKLSQLFARVALGHIFLLSGLSKFGAYQGIQGYMEAMGIPGSLLPAVIAGWKIRWASYALAGFSVLAAILFHSNYADQIQMITFMKNIAISGGLVLLAVHGAGAYSVDNRGVASSRAVTTA